MLTVRIRPNGVPAATAMQGRTAGRPPSTAGCPCRRACPPEPWQSSPLTRLEPVCVASWREQIFAGRESRRRARRSYVDSLGCLSWPSNSVRVLNSELRAGNAAVKPVELSTRDEQHCNIRCKIGGPQCIRPPTPHAANTANIAAAACLHSERNYRVTQGSTTGSTTMVYVHA